MLACMPQKVCRVRVRTRTIAMVGLGMHQAPREYTNICAWVLVGQGNGLNKKVGQVAAGKYWPWCSLLTLVAAGEACIRAVNRAVPAAS